MTDLLTTIESAIRDPIGAPPLWEIVEPGQTVAFVICDPSRTANTHEFLPVLIDEIHAVGVPYEDLCIVFAAGSHGPMSEAEMALEVGKEVASRIKMVSSDDDLYSNQYVAQARHVILTGSVRSQAENHADDDWVERSDIRRPAFLFYVVLNEENQILRVFAGNHVLAHQAARSFADEVHARRVSGLSD